MTALTRRCVAHHHFPGCKSKVKVTVTFQGQIAFAQ